ncbi:MAG: zinc ribbon domain-containing protein [Actinobacteria bacterium]|nr:zinc ribbon domain-containing protein [Actinomycetota bacterium]
MPLYEYQCNNCKERFTVLQPVGEGSENVTCPYCDSKDVKKIFSPFASLFGSSGGSNWGGGCTSFG